MSFPAIWQNPSVNRIAHLQVADSEPTRRDKKPTGPHRDKEGKRRIRRRENAKFTSNPRIVAPSPRDYVLSREPLQSTFPEPLPPFLSRNTQAPSHVPPLPDPHSSVAGQFTLALKGVRKQLRRSGGRAEQLVTEIETEVLSWLETDPVVLFPDADVPMDPPRISSLSPLGPIREVERSYPQLVWAVAEDSFARYIVHCVCRWHNIVSFSKPASPEGPPRLTYLLRPHVSRITGQEAHMFDTPPPTELDSASSAVDSQESDFAASESDILPEDDGTVSEGEMSLPPPEPSVSLQEPPPPPVVPLPEMQRLSLDALTHRDVDTIPLPTTRLTRRGLPRNSGVIRSSARSASSPSPSPPVRWRYPLPVSARTIPREPSVMPQKNPHNPSREGTFWAYLYA